MAINVSGGTRFPEISLQDDRVEIRSKKYFGSDDWDNTLRQLDDTCLLLKECIRKYPDNVALIEKLLKAQDQLFQATKVAEEQRQKIWMDQRELNLEEGRRRDIWQASDPTWGTNERLGAMKSIPVYHRK